MSLIYDRNNLLFFCGVGLAPGKSNAARQVYLRASVLKRGIRK